MSPIPWTFKFGRLFGIQIRLHIFFVLVIFILPLRGLRHGMEGFLWSLGWVASLYLFVLLHELGHCWAAIRSGSSAESITLWPLGGLATITGSSNRPKETVFVAFSGPGVNLLLMLVIGGVLAAIGGTIGWNPFAWPHGFVQGLFRINLILFLFNMLPAVPLDGGRILQGILATRLGYGKSVLVATYVGQIAAGILGLAGLYNPSTEARIWMVVIALYMFVMAGFERKLLREGHLYTESERTFGYDFSGGYTTVEEAEKPQRASWWQQRREMRAQRRAARAAREEAALRKRVDELLEKVSASGMDSLSASERRFLDEASKKFRAPR